MVNLAVCDEANTVDQNLLKKGVRVKNLALTHRVF